MTREQAWERHVARENTRLTVHFDTVIDELERRDVSDYTASQRAMRRLQIARLRGYRDGQRFPRNRGERSRQTPIFRDASGSWCAMGQLVAESGAEAFAREVSDLRNLATIHDLADDPRLHDWLRAHGLSLAEAARIQPAYGRRPTEPYECICLSSVRDGESTAVLRVRVGDEEAMAIAVVEQVDGEGFEVGETLPLERPVVRESGTYLVVGTPGQAVELGGPGWSSRGWLPVAEDGSVSCPENYSGSDEAGLCRDPSLAYTGAVEALTAKDCKAYLTEVDPDWTRPCPEPRGIGCSGAAGAPLASSGVPLAVVALAAMLWLSRTRRAR